MVRKYLFVSLVFALGLFGLYEVALEYGFLMLLWWYDIPMHIVGGVTLGFLALWFFSAFEERTPFRFPFSISSLTLVAVFIGGVSWEIFEYHFELIGNPVFSYPVDTAKDLVMDTLGALISLWAFFKVGKLANQPAL